jgi:acyl carrier protein
MDDNNLDLLRRVLTEEFDISAEAIVPDAQLYEALDLDSIDAVDLLVRLKEETGKKVPPDQFKSVRTVGDVVKVLDAL